MPIVIQPTNLIDIWAQDVDPEVDPPTFQTVPVQFLKPYIWYSFGTSFIFEVPFIYRMFIPPFEGIATLTPYPDNTVDQYWKFTIQGNNSNFVFSLNAWQLNWSGDDIEYVYAIARNAYVF